MIEIPEAVTLARQLSATLGGKVVSRVVAGASPHKFAWLYGRPDVYTDLAVGGTVTGGSAVAGFALMHLGERRVIFSEGMAVRYHGPDAGRPAKHQLLIEFSDGSALSASARMYGGAGIVSAAGFDNPYFRAATERPSPLSDGFTRGHFQSLVDDAPASATAKALLATEQRIPGLGNGVLQDILFRARVHPKRKVSDMTGNELDALHESVRSTLREMTDQGGRDTEVGLLGDAGGYATLMARTTVRTPCPACGATIEKASYLGGSVYYCPACQRP